MRYTKVAINVPDINRSYANGTYKFSAPATIQANKTVIDAVFKKYGAFISKWGTEFEIDDSIGTCFIATESMGQNLPANTFGATGLMQMTAETVWEILAKWEKITGSKLSKTASAFFNAVLPESKTFDANVLPNAALKAKITLMLYTNPEFNIAIGLANIRWLLEAFREGGLSQINKVFIAYNAGYYATRNKVKGPLTTLSLVNNKSFPLESRSYLLKMLGVNGFLQLWFERN